MAFISEPGRAEKVSNLSGALPGIERSIFDYQVLGSPGRDNALFVKINTGQNEHRVLFDCGYGCLDKVPVNEIQKIDALCLSHLHMDHISGFDQFLKFHFDRADGGVKIFGPAETASIIQHKLQGFLWDRVLESPGIIEVTEIGDNEIASWQFKTAEKFAQRHLIEKRPRGEVVFSGTDISIRANVLDHGSPCIGYVVERTEQMGVNAERMSELGLKGGVWLKQLKDPRFTEQTIIIAGSTYETEALRNELIERRGGEKISYLTDFYLPTEAAIDNLARLIKGSEILVCENNYRNQDADLARKNGHLISDQVSDLANRAQVQKLVLFHISDRYEEDQWREQLVEVRSLFPKAAFPESWSI